MHPKFLSALYQRLTFSTPACERPGLDQSTQRLTGFRNVHGIVVTTFTGRTYLLQFPTPVDYCFWYELCNRMHKR